MQFLQWNGGKMEIMNEEGRSKINKWQERAVEGTSQIIASLTGIAIV